MGEGQTDLFVVSNKLHAERQPFAHILDIDWSVPLFLFTIYVKKKIWLLWFQILVLLFSHNQKHTELINQFRMIRCRLSCFLSPSHRGLLWSRVAVSMLMSSQYSAGERDLIDLNWTRQMDGSSGPFGKRDRPSVCHILIGSASGEWSDTPFWSSK